MKSNFKCLYGEIFGIINLNEVYFQILLVNLNMNEVKTRVNMNEVKTKVTFDYYK
jgi:hypothetical protein